MRLITLDQDAVQAKEGMGLLAVSISRSSFSVSESEAAQLCAAEEHVLAFQDTVKKYSHEQANTDHYAAKEAYEKSPTPANEAALVEYADRHRVKAEYAHTRKALEADARAHAVKVVLPLVLPIYRRAINAVKEEADSLAASDKAICESFRHPHSESGLVVVLRQLAKSMEVRLLDLETVGVVSAFLPSSFLREIVHFESK